MTEITIANNNVEENIIHSHQDNTGYLQFTIENYETLKDLCQNNANYFKNNENKTSQRFYSAFLRINEQLDNLWNVILELDKISEKFDFDKETPGNGFRSFLIVIDSAMLYCINICKMVSSKRNSIFFRKRRFIKKIEACASLWATLELYGNGMHEILITLEDDDLILKHSFGSRELIEKFSYIFCKSDCHGRTLGFQFSDSMRKTLRFVVFSMIIYSEVYYSESSFSKAKNLIVASVKYLFNEERRSKRFVNITQGGTVDFCKSFWLLNEGKCMQTMAVIGKPVAVSKIIQIPPEPLAITVDNKEIVIPIPKSHIGEKCLPVRLISYKVRKGMIGEKQDGRKILPRSRGLIIHCHGGGFIAQSSRSHEVYLRQWAKQLEVPILSIDYSLTPEAPFPRAIEEVTYAYCWAMKNHDLLGSTGERIIFAGDSAGGNLSVTVSLNCIQLGIPVPSGLFLAYTAFSVNLLPFPSHMLSLIDPLLPVGFMVRILKEYVKPYLIDYDESIINNDEEGTSSSNAIANGSPTDSAEITNKPLNENQISVTHPTSSSLILQASHETLDRMVENVIAIESENVDEDIDLIEESGSNSNTLPIADQGNGLPSSQSNKRPSIKDRIFSSIRRKRVDPDTVDIIKKYKDRKLSVLKDCAFVTPENPLMSPILGTDDDLRKLPPIKIMQTHLDPCLDGAVYFAKKIKKLGNTVTMDILHGLPHGFLNLVQFSKEANDGLHLSIERIRELLDLENLPPEISN